MAGRFDQLFVTLKHWAVALFPGAGQPLVSILLSIIPIIAVFGLLFALVTVIERKGLGRIQNRLGPNRVGIPLTTIRLHGFGQFIADGIKALIKEDVVPRAADPVVHYLAPIALVVPVLLAYSVWSIALTNNAKSPCPYRRNASCWASMRPASRTFWTLVAQCPDQKNVSFSWSW